MFYISSMFYSQCFFIQSNKTSNYFPDTVINVKAVMLAGMNHTRSTFSLIARDRMRIYNPYVMCNIMFNKKAYVCNMRLYIYQSVRALCMDKMNTTILVNWHVLVPLFILGTFVAFFPRTSELKYCIHCVCFGRWWPHYPGWILRKQTLPHISYQNFRQRYAGIRMIKQQSCWCPDDTRNQGITSISLVIFLRMICDTWTWWEQI